MLLKCCLIHAAVIILRQNLGQFILYLCDLFFIFILISIVSNYIISCIFILYYSILFLDDNMDEKSPA